MRWDKTNQSIFFQFVIKVMVNLYLESLLCFVINSDSQTSVIFWLTLECSMSWKSTSFTERTWSPSWSPALWASESGTTCNNAHARIKKIWQWRLNYNQLCFLRPNLRDKDSQLWSLSSTNIEAQLCSWRFLQHNRTRQELRELVVVIRVMNPLNKKNKEHPSRRVAEKPWG